MTGHAIYAPSSAHRWIPCTASAAAIAQLGEQEEGEEARDGTAAHDELERVLNGGAPNDDHPAAYLVALAVDYVRQLPPGQLWVEQRVELTKDIWGRCDVGHWDPIAEVLTIVDAKNGQRMVDADENPQLRIYAAGSIFTHNLPARFIRYAVVQPNDWRPYVPRVKQWSESIESLYAWAQAVAAIPSGPLTFTAGEQCRDCPLFGRCDASRDMLAQLGAVFCNAPADVPPARRALVKALEKPITDWFKNADKAWLKDALAGKVPPEMKLVTATKHRVWKDEIAARAAIVEKFGVDVLKPPTPAQAEELGLDVTGLADTPTGGPALAFESDKRKEWKQPSAKEMFADALASLNGSKP
jgi:hypothetical protein